MVDGDRRSILALLSFDIAALQAERIEILTPKAPKQFPNLTLSPSAVEWASLVAAEKPCFPDLPQPRNPEQPETTLAGEYATVAAHGFGSSNITNIEFSNGGARLARKLVVKPETSRFLARMYPITPEKYAAKLLDWMSFVLAMDDAGFLATHSGESAVAFTEEVEGRIVLHKPHPVPMIGQV